MADTTMLPLDAYIYLPILVPCLLISIAFASYTLYQQNPSSPFVKPAALKPLFLSKLSKTSQNAPREAYDIPPRSNDKSSSFKRFFARLLTPPPSQDAKKTHASVPKMNLPPPNEHSSHLSLSPWTTSSYAIGAALTISAGIVLLHEADSSAALIALGISISIVPILMLVQRVRRSDTARGITVNVALAVMFSIINGIIAWRGSPYASLALVAVALLANTALLILSFLHRRSARQGRIRLPTTIDRVKQDMDARRRRVLERRSDNRKTMSFFSGGVLDEMTTKTRPEERVMMEAEETLREDEPNSWLTSPCERDEGAIAICLLTML